MLLVLIAWTAVNFKDRQPLLWLNVFLFLLYAIPFGWRFLDYDAATEKCIEVDRYVIFRYTLLFFAIQLFFSCMVILIYSITKRINDFFSGNNFNTIRDAFISWLVHRMALPFVKHFVKPGLIRLSLNDLHGLPENSFGHDLYLFMRKNNFSIIPYFETHDAKHVLLDYGVTGKDEACMQFFYLGNKHYSAASIVTAFVSLVIMPEGITHFLRAYRRGKNARPVGKLELGNFLRCETKKLQELFEIPSNSMMKRYV
jgi:hypothetical protein